MKRIIALVLCLMMMVCAFAACGTSDDSQSGEKDKLVMATNAEFPPYEFRDADNNIVGIDAEIMAAVAENMGMELVIEDMEFDSIIPAVKSGKADIGAAGMTVREDRLENVDFSDTYAKAKQVVIVKNDSGIAGLDDLTGKKIGVQQGTTGDIYAADEYGDENVDRYSKGYEAVQALSQGKVDAVIIDNEPAKVFVSQTDGIMILDEPFADEEYAIAVQKGNTELLDQINASLAKLKESGKFDEIINKYINAD